MARIVAWVKAQAAKGGNLTAVPLNSAARAVLDRQAETAVAGEERVFPVQPCVHTQWRRYTKAAGLPEAFRFHYLRHTFVSWHAIAGTEEPARPSRVEEQRDGRSLRASAHAVSGGGG